MQMGSDTTLRMATHSGRRSIADESLTMSVTAAARKMRR